MASKEDLAFFRKQQELDPENKKCFECRGYNPQWMNIWHGIYLCLECSGVHRSLGTHISFVRSMGMDTWPEEKMALMRVGGNSKCRKFFESKGITSDVPTREKYATDAAALYKDMLAAEAKGERFDEASWKPPVRKSNYVSQAQNTARAEPGFGSQKYAGIGAPSTHGRGNQDVLGDAGAALSKGWSSFTSALTDAAAVASAKAQEGSKSMQSGDSWVSKSASSGWGSLTSWAKAVASPQEDEADDFMAALKNSNLKKSSKYQGMGSEANNSASPVKSIGSASPAPSGSPTPTPTKGGDDWGWNDDDDAEGEPSFANSVSNDSTTSTGSARATGSNPRKKGLGLGAKPVSKGASLSSLKKVPKKGE